MSSNQLEFPPVCEPVSLSDLKNFLRVTISDDDSLISSLAIAAREYCEEFCARRFINAGLLECMDSFPYYTDTMVSQMAYPPSYYSLPRYSTTLWNYSQMIKLFYSRVRWVDHISYVSSTDSQWHKLTGTADMANSAANFLLDTQSEPGRIFPPAGQFWPSVLYVPNAVQIHYRAGYNDDIKIAKALEALSPALTPATSAEDVSGAEVALRQADVPERIKLAIQLLTAFYYEHRDESVDVPEGIHRHLWLFRVVDFAPTRG